MGTVSTCSKRYVDTVVYYASGPGTMRNLHRAPRQLVPLPVRTLLGPDLYAAHTRIEHKRDYGKHVARVVSTRVVGDVMQTAQHHLAPFSQWQCCRRA
jgi:hypothetical protein